MVWWIIRRRIHDEAVKADLSWFPDFEKWRRPSHAGIDAYREENDWLGQFLEEYCDVDPSLSEKSGELYQAYRNVCMTSGEYIRSTTDFYGSLEKAGFIRRKLKAGKMVMGLRLKAGQDFLN